MPNYTSNYKLTKPTPNELYNIDIQNNNMDNVDTNLKKVSDVANEANSRSKTNESNLEALKTFQEDPFEETGKVVQVDLFQDAPLNVVSHIEPIQEGSGDPYPAGGGKNLVNATCKGETIGGSVVVTKNEDGYYTLNGTATANGVLVVCEMLLPAGTYTLSHTVESGSTDNTGNAVAQLVAKETNTILAFTRADVKSVTYTLAEDTNVLIRLYVSNGKTYNNWKIAAQLEEGTNATAYAPYANIRPISGHTGAKLVRCGKNLVDKNNVMELNAYFNTTLTTITADTVNRTLYVRCKPNTSYYVTHASNAGTYNIGYTKEKPQIGTEVYGISGARGMYRTGADAEYIVCRYYHTQNSSITQGEVLNAMQIEEGDAPTNIEHNAKTFTATFGQTVYGGALDWNTGILTINKALKTYTGVEQFQGLYEEGSIYRVGINLTGAKLGGECVCSHYKYLLNGTNEANTMWVSTSRSNVFFTSKVHTTVEEFQEYFSEQNAAGTPIQVVYELETSKTVQLTPIELSALAGCNTLYSDCGDTTVSGRKDIIWLTHSLIKRIEALEAQAAGL